MAAMAKHDMAITLMPSMRSRCASMKRLPAMRRMTAAAAAQPAMIRKSRKPKESGEISAVPRNTCVNRLAVSGVMATETMRLASVSAASSPSSAAIAGDDIRPGADICSTSMK